MKKIIKKIGNSLGLIFNKEEQELYDIEKEDYVDVEIYKIKDKGERRKLKRWEH